MELTPKRAPRYAQILTAFRHRLDRGDGSRVVYLCTPDSAQAVRAALRQSAARPMAAHVDVHVVFSEHTASWDGDTLPQWLTPFSN